MEKYMGNNANILEVSEEDCKSSETNIGSNRFSKKKVV